MSHSEPRTLGHGPRFLTSRLGPPLTVQTGSPERSPPSVNKPSQTSAAMLKHNFYFVVFPVGQSSGERKQLSNASRVQRETNFLWYEHTLIVVVEKHPTNKQGMKQ